MFFEIGWNFKKEVYVIRSYYRYALKNTGGNMNYITNWGMCFTDILQTG